MYLVIVDDGSQTPVSEDELLGYLPKAYAMKVITLDINQGITTALNTGLQWIEAHLAVTYIARLDCGDICHEDRFYQQIYYLQQHPKVGLLGSWCIFQSPDAELRYEYTTPTQHEDLIKEMHLRNAFIHPTVVFKKELVEEIGSYPTSFEHVEDYALFFRMMQKTRTAILNQFLVTCEINPKGISIKNRMDQLKGRYMVVQEYGRNSLWKLLGKLKLKLLMLTPYSTILKIKNAN